MFSELVHSDILHRLISECLDKLKRLVQRRDTKKKRSRTSDEALEPRKPKRRRTAAQEAVWLHRTIVLDEGTLVAALTDESNIPPMWILARVQSFQGYPGGDRSFYEVLDEDCSGPVRKRYKLPPWKLIPLPSLEDVPISRRGEFAVDEEVLAVYPGTTVFYPARVLKTPTPQAQGNIQYTVMFNDDGDEPRKVNALHIAPQVTIPRDDNY